MTRSLKLQAAKYPSFGKCIFCFCTDDLTDEHVVPEALSGAGEIIIVKGSCRSCNNCANEHYEQPALKNDFLPLRYMLELKRKRKGRKSQPARMPPVSYTARLGSPQEEFNEHIEPENYPSTFEFIIRPPAGHLTGEDRSGELQQMRIGILELGREPNFIRPQIATSHRFVLGAPEMTVAKMAYCYAVAERGLTFMDLSDLRDLLMGRRADVFNFVGGALEKECLSRTHLHKFYFRKRGHFLTMLVHLFASFGGPIYEVVLGKR